MVHIAPNKEESPIIGVISTVLEKFEYSIKLTRAHDCSDIKDILSTEPADLLLVSSSYKPQALFERVQVCAEHMARYKDHIPLLYLVDWNVPFPSLLGTQWGGKVGVLHTQSSEAEVTSTFQRLGELGEAVDLLAYHSLHIRKKAARP
jgi:hypothetical protein